MATNYGSGIYSNHGKLTVNGKTLDQLDSKTLYAALNYMGGLGATSFSNKRKNGLGGTGFLGSSSSGSKRDNWYAEQTKLARELEARGYARESFQNGGLKKTNRIIDPRLTALGAPIGVSNDRNEAILAKWAPMLQSEQGASPQVTSLSLAQNQAIATQQRRVQSLLAGRRDVAKLGI